ncbi:uncharacterized protein F4812DRAFT_233933 [Daldinia caldariorum]|uniref:uncharacterized protein n=1 Tax=Daldinia caldariorum TaxID=326644 RepID=UPI002008365D|nr:uncharacterized protein F4812DRAFT_233933 [Daldinia caldariorum]KAI1463839.1 hypothetical protein F4812DRAFT_233933 [Daldinia caldariorum]
MSDAMSRNLVVHLTHNPRLSPDSVESGSDSTEYGQEVLSGTASGKFTLMEIPEEAGPSGSSGQASEVKPTSTSSKRGYRKRTHSPEVWETHKAEIGRLYLDENKRLKDVMEIMEERWGFRASQKMYKTKLTQWKFFKNNRQVDVANLLYLQRHRLAIGKETTFRRNGKLIDVEAYMRRRGVNAFDLVEVADLGDLPPTVRCRTPPSVPRLLEPPGELCIKERFFQWTSQTFVKPRPLDTDYLKKLDAHHTSNALLSVQLLTHGCWLFSEGRNMEGGWFCRGAFALLHHILETSAALSFFEMMMAIQRYPNAEIMRELWSYLSRYAGAIDGVNQPLHRLLASFAKFSQQHGLEHNVNLLDWAIEWASGRFNSSFDGKPFDYALLKPWDLGPIWDSYHRYYLCLNHWEVDKIPTATLPKLETVQDPSNLRADLLLIFGNQCSWSDDRLPKIALETLEQNRLSPSPSDYLQFIGDYCMARYNKTRSSGEDPLTSAFHKSAREYLESAANLQGKAWPPGKNYYETLTLLESWYLEAGDYESADATRRKRDHDCAGIFKSLSK